MSTITALSEPPRSLSPLEMFVCEYVETIGGAWDEVEPQVYDLLVPSEQGEDGSAMDPQEILRLAFDPDAIPEHPEAQLASFGTPLVDRLLADGLRRGQCARLYLTGLNFTPYNLERRLRRGLRLEASLELHFERVRVLYFPQAIFWFQATFISDQKEYEILPVAIDLHYGRQVRHIDALLNPSRLAQTPPVFGAQVRRCSMASAYGTAQDRVIRTLAARANARSRELAGRVERQIARMCRYYGDLKRELEEQVKRAQNRADDLSRYSGRREAIDREERLRIAELRQKSALRLHVRLCQLLLLDQPKLRVSSVLVAPNGTSGQVNLVWDPLTKSLEAVPCNQGKRPTLWLALNRHGHIVCDKCSAQPTRSS